MERNGEDVRRVGAARDVAAWIRSGRPWKRIAGNTRTGKNHGCAIALMDVAINSHRGANLAITLHTANGDGNVVDHAEALAVTGEGMMESTANVDGHAVVEGTIGCQHGTARGEPEGAH